MITIVAVLLVIVLAARAFLGSPRPVSDGLAPLTLAAGAALALVWSGWI